MTKEELEKDYYADRPTEPYSDDDNPNDWANIAHYAEENLEKAFKRIEELEKELEFEKSVNGEFSAMEKLRELKKENAELENEKCELLGIIQGKDKAIADLRDNYENFKAVAEPEIKSLKEENAELKESLKTAYKKGMRHMAKALKDYDRTEGAWTDYFEHTVDKVLQREQVDFEEYGTLADQLTKAKELLKWALHSDVEHTDSAEFEKKWEEAEQFLKDSEVEK